MYSTLFHCKHGNCLHIITNTITGSKSYRIDLHNLILKFGKHAPCVTLPYTSNIANIAKLTIICILFLRNLDQNM